MVATENVAVCPTVTFWLTGCAVIDGDVGVGVLPALLTVPAHPEKERPPNRTSRRRSPDT